MSLKKLLVSALCALCAVSLMIPVAFAHGGHGRAARNWQAGTSRYAACPVEDCTLTGRHVHDGVTYCGFHHANGWCDGTCIALCPVEDCTLAGRHIHDGVTYCGANHAAGYCGGNCPYTTGTTTGTWGTWGGCHGGGRHCGW